MPSNGAPALTRGITGLQYARDTAPSPDGRVIYTIHEYGMARFVLNQAGTTYVRDAAYAPDPVVYRFVNDLPVTKPPCGRGIATDSYGFVYVAIGGWCAPMRNGVAKYDPAGRLVTVFGESGPRVRDDEDPATANPGLFYTTPMGIDVTRDGTRIYVGDTLNYRVQVFAQQANGAYAFETAVRTSSAAYGVSLDPWGTLFATGTTQGHIFTFAAAPSFAPLGLVVDYPGVAEAPHEISTDAFGGVYSHDHADLWRRTGDPLPPLPGPVGPQPVPDTLAPTVTSVVGPAETTTDSVPLAIAWVDADSAAIAMVRVADESGVWRAWQPFATPLAAATSAGFGYKRFTVQLRDPAGNESAPFAMPNAVLRRAPAAADTTAPSLAVVVPAEAASTTVPLAVTSADDVGVVAIRIAGNDGAFGAWSAWSGGTAALTVRFAGVDRQFVYVQVRDAAFNVSTTETGSVWIGPRAPATDPGPPGAAQAPVPTVEAPGTAPDVDAAGGGDDEHVAPGPDDVADGEVATPVPVRDASRPRLTTVLVPRSTCSRRVMVAIRARDDRGVTHVRVANDRGRYGRWRAFAPRIVHQLAPGRGTKRLRVQVRDRAGNVSNVMVRMTVVRACGRSTGVKRSIQPNRIHRTRA